MSNLNLLSADVLKTKPVITSVEIAASDIRPPRNDILKQKSSVPEDERQSSAIPPQFAAQYGTLTPDHHPDSAITGEPVLFYLRLLSSAHSSKRLRQWFSDELLSTRSLSD